jgi:hypothetical protein
MKSLEALRQALVYEDKRLLRGDTLIPLGGWDMPKALVSSCCPVAWCGWQGEGLHMVYEIQDFFARICHEADKLLGEEAACGYFTAAWDANEISRDELLSEVELALQRGGELAATG